jgi:simple sugar transport system ATP-binding protein
MIAVQPTRGLDVGAVESAHRLLMERRTAGAAILLISEDLDEVLALSDRIAVLFEGRIAGIVDAADADVTTIGLQMTGGTGAEQRTDAAASVDGAAAAAGAAASAGGAAGEAASTGDEA